MMMHKIGTELSLDLQWGHRVNMLNYFFRFLPSHTVFRVHVVTENETHTALDLQRALFRNERFMLNFDTLEKCFKICHIFIIRKPMQFFLIFHFMQLSFFLYVDIDQGIH